MAEFTITVSHTTTGKDITMAVEPQFSVNDVLEVLTENLQLKDKHVLANHQDEILSPEASLEESGVKEGDVLVLMPDPTGG
jgi:uncharacterized ubiquitin-like protein YukD